MQIDEKLATYVKEMNDKPLLSPEREIELSNAIQLRLAIYAHIQDETERHKAENQDENLGKLIEEITTHNLRLVIKEAFRFSKTTGANVKDLIGHGNIGLMTAAYMYNAAKFGTRFSTYATYWIRQAMFEAVHNIGGVTIPTHIINGRYRLSKLMENGIVTDADIMEELEINENQLKRIRIAEEVSEISMDQEVGNGQDGNTTNLTVGDLIADDKAVDPSDCGDPQEKYRYLYDALGELDEQSRDIITAQLMLDDKVHLRELGEKYGKTGERIRQIRKNALEQLRKKLGKKMVLERGFSPSIKAVKESVKKPKKGKAHANKF
jgi:RNA polymerase sigma factor (sigma-70 family)